MMYTSCKSCGTNQNTYIGRLNYVDPITPIYPVIFLPKLAMPWLNLAATLPNLDVRRGRGALGGATSISMKDLTINSRFSGHGNSFAARSCMRPLMGSAAARGVLGRSGATSLEKWRSSIE